jgi:hypothetical protein
MQLLSSLLAARAKVLLVGPPGIGKTGRVHAVASAAGFRVVVMRASLAERVDFGGALVPDVQAGITRALPLELLRDLQITTTPTLLFLDDLGQAPIDVQAALMRLFDAGALSPSVLIWGATNRPADRAGVSALCEPLRSRFDVAFSLPTPGATDRPDGAMMLHDWSAELDSWVAWAIGADVPPEVIAWHRSTAGRTLYQWQPSADPAVRMPDYRTWETVARLWRAGVRCLTAIGAAIGKSAAAEFSAFAALASELPSPDQVRIDPEGAIVPEQPAALYLTVSMLAASAQPRDAAPFTRYLRRLPRIYGALLGRDLHQRLGARMAGEPAWIAWFNQNQELFAS